MEGLTDVFSDAASSLVTGSTHGASTLTPTYMLKNGRRSRPAVNVLRLHGKRWIVSDLNTAISWLENKNPFKGFSDTKHLISFAHMSAAAPPSSCCSFCLQHLTHLPPSESLLTSLAAWVTSYSSHSHSTCFIKRGGETGRRYYAGIRSQPALIPAPEMRSIPQPTTEKHTEREEWRDTPVYTCAGALSQAFEKKNFFV